MRHELVSLAIADDKRRRVFATGKAQGTALLAIKPRDLTVGDGRSGLVFSAIISVTRQTEFRCTKYPLITFEPNS